MKLVVSKIGQPTTNDNIIVTLQARQTVKNPFGIEKTVNRTFCYAMPKEGAEHVSEGQEVEFDMSQYNVIERENESMDDDGNVQKLTSSWIHEKVSMTAK